MTFEAELAARLRDLAAAAEGDGWADPLPAVSRPEPPTSLRTRPSAAGRRLRLLPYFAVAAVFLAVVVGVGAVIVGARGNSGRATAAGGFAAAGDQATDASGPVTAGGVAPEVSCGPAPTASGPLATLVTVTARPPDPLPAGGSVPVTFTFNGTGPTLQARAGQTLLISGSRVLAQSTGARSFAIVAIPVQPGSQESSVTFDATACNGGPVPTGTYQLVVAYAYTTADGGSGTLVSAPVAVAVR